MKKESWIEVAKLLLGAGFVWIAFWGCAADTEGDGWGYVLGMILVGLGLIAIGLLIGALAEGGEDD